MDADSQPLALLAINRLTDAIYQRFGLRVAMGAEVEYCAYSNQKHKGLNPDNPLDVSMAAKTSGEPAKYFESSSYISSHYKEKPPNQYEVVLDHNAFSHPAQLAHAIVECKGKIRQLGERRDMRITFDPAIDACRSEGLTTNALHLNFSLLNAQGDNILGTSPNLAHYLLHRCMDVMEESTAIHAPTPASYDRFHKKNSGFEPQRFDHLHGLRLRTNQTADGITIPETCRLENRFPDSDANPYTNIAATLASIYYALSRSEELSMDTGFPTPNKPYSVQVDRGLLPRTLKEATEKLQNSVCLRSAINDVSQEDRLGDRLCDALVEEFRAHSPKKQSGWARQFRPGAN